MAVLVREAAVMAREVVDLTEVRPVMARTVRVGETMAAARAGSSGAMAMVAAEVAAAVAACRGRTR